MAEKKQISIVIPTTQEGWITRLALTQKCRHCAAVADSDDPWCIECEGAGEIPTDAGLAILELVRRNWKELSRA